MLAAILDNGIQIIITQEMTKDDLRKLKESHRFHCPQCMGKMWLKMGDVRIPHFAHAAKSACRRMFSEGETVAHLAGKQQLYEMFTKLGLRTGMETTLTSIGQRPDLLVEHRGRAHAIEFQCSRIPPALVRSRTEGYEQVGIIPHWIPLTPDKWSASGQPVRTLSISDFLQLFIHHDRQYGTYLMTYDPITVHFVYFVHPMHISGNTFVGKVVAVPHTLQKFPFAVPSPTDEKTFEAYLRLYMTRRNAHLKRRLIFSRKGIQDPLLRACYENGLQVDRLSPLIGVPTRGADIFKENDAEWQARFVFMAYSHSPGDPECPRMIRRFLEQMSVKNEEGFEAVFSYLHFLRRSGVKTLTDILECEKLTALSVDHLWKEFLASHSEY